MAATDAQIARLRRMTAEPNDATYDDEDLAGYIERYPLLDQGGESPFVTSATVPPAQEPNPAWTPTYDLHAAAADVWEEKAANAAQDYTFIADGGVHTRSQVYEQYMKTARHHRSRRALGSITVVVYPSPGRMRLPVGNAPESD